MANTASARIQMEILGREILADGLKAGTINSMFREVFDIDNGVTVGAIDLVYAERQTGIAASTTTVIDIVAGINDAYGTSISMAEVVLIAVRNRRTTALAYLQVGPDATNGFGILASSRGFWSDASDRNVVAPSPGGGDPTTGTNSWLVMHNYDGVLAAAASTDEIAIITSGVSGSTNAWDLLVLARSAAA